MARRSIVIVGDYCEDTYVFARKRRQYHLSEPETPIESYPFEAVHVPTLAPALGDYVQKMPDVLACYDGGKPDGKYARSMCWVSPQKQNGKTIWCINRHFQLVPGQDKNPVTNFDSSELTYSKLSGSSQIPVFCMDYDQGWRIKYWETFANLINKRPYIIRCHDPRRTEWKRFRERLKDKAAGVKRGIWLCHSVDLANGALRAPGIWEDHRRIISGWLQQDKTLCDKDWLHYIIVKVDQDGILILGPGTGKNGILFISAGDQPGSFIRKHPRHVMGNGLVFFASFVRAVTKVPRPKEKKMKEELVKCAKEGLVRSRGVTARGYKHPDEGNQWHETCKLKDILDDPEPKGFDSLINYDENRSKKPFERASDIVCGSYSKFRESIAFTLGNLATADDEFARSLLTLESRLRAHRDSGNKSVLSFAVFGEPGSGKSFVAKELIRSLDREDALFEQIPFNLSQFGYDRDRLVAAFRKIEGAAKSKIPFVLWDEFDTAIEGESCAWLRDFLMPMQDAQFFDGARVGELGKCVFVFMGGFYPDDQEFLEWANGKGKMLKGPDFHSRLQSSLPLPRVTPRKGVDFDSKEQLTRAILIRTYLRQHKSIKLISQDVLAFLLHVPLPHGARSLEQIIKASALGGTEIYSRWHLPSIDVLRLHIKDLKIEPVDQEKTGDREESLDLVGSFVKYDLKQPELIEEKYLPLLWRSYHPSISKELSIDLKNPTDRDLLGRESAKVDERIEALAEKLALETHELWRRNCLDPPTADSPYNYIKDYDDRVDKDYSHLPESEKEQYVAAAMEAIREQMGWGSESKE